MHHDPDAGIFKGFLIVILNRLPIIKKQESRAVARKSRNAAAVLFGLNFADSIHCKFKSSQASTVRLQSSKHTGAKQLFNAKWPFTLRSFVTHFGSRSKGDKVL